MKIISSKFLSLFLPHKCTFCREAISYKNNTFICESCMENIPFIKGDVCVRCSSPRQSGSMPVCNTCRKYSHPFTSSFTPLTYTGKVRRALLNLKFHNKENYCRSFSFLIANNIMQKGYPDFDFITYIPLPPERLKERGFNQSELIAKGVGSILNIPVTDTLFRVNGSAKQSSLSSAERRKNPKKSFFARDMKLKGTALLIDDIYTTGSTLAYTSSLLLKMGCDKVYIATAALQVKK
ncbi:MAG: ComF family protein [Clostridia bacterium]|nr:ComF family protein [Clostridia bacterium]